MKNMIKKMISLAAILCLLAASLAGCGSKTVTEATQTAAPSQQEIQQENGQNPQHGDGAMEAPEMASIQMEIPEEDVKALRQAGLDAVAEESELWSISEITDMEVLMQLMQNQSGGRERPEGGNFDGERPENMTPPDGEFAERPDGGMPDGTMPEWDGENPPEGTLPDGEMPEGGQGRGEGGGRQPGNRGGGMPGLAIVIANAEGASVSVEDVLAEIEAAAETLGYSTMSMEITEEQTALLEIPDGYIGSRIVLINAQMPEMETWEPAG